MDREELNELLDEALSDVAPKFKIVKGRNGKLMVDLGLFEDEDGDIFDEEMEEDVDEDDVLDTDEDVLPLEEDDDED